ncbi:MAG: PEP/pyruvate-binding domain-containing protein, partial [Actinoplanes sp.]
MRVIALSEAGAGAVELVGGKAAGLGEMIRLGFRVPEGFAVSPEATPAEITEAYAGLGEGPVAVRSSATVEDSPDASYAGQMATELNVHGPDAVLAAVDRCRRSALSAPAVAYRGARGEDGPVRMGVVVQRMVDAAAAGVLFTADPVTGRRTTMLVDAAPGLGTTVVDGATDVDHYVLDENGWSGTGCVSPGTLAELQDAGARLQEHFGSPQDIEWAIDRDGLLWLLQTRPITTLFPAPPATGGEPRVYLEFGHVQGMLQPVTPMGMSSLKALVTAMLVPLGIKVEITDIGGRLYGDMSGLARDPAARKRLVKLLAVDFGPRAQAAMERVLADPRFAPRPGRREGGAMPP